MDGPWQMGHKTATEVRKSCSRDCPPDEIYGSGGWRLLHAEAPIWKCLPLAPGSIPFLMGLTIRLDYLSLHQYYGYSGRTADFLASSKGHG